MRLRKQKEKLNKKFKTLPSFLKRKLKNNIGRVFSIKRSKNGEKILRLKYMG